ncbi:hypothetical protein B7R56_15865 [Pseudomonas savastanoi pv. retacarpa]|uniref:Uncharacterized protein n=1 Tax=Pseudomonas savastanoi pv. savastanoi NCPPB 3335 TaxID=693985 RepID=A0ABC8B7G0_PSESS|nr:hypothetical protein PSA3335_03060 [Pseudomonas savastanoi pv. savastanoi NCPPB 3335]OSR27461.1 hypothetical protein B7R56_15865 [Pseudomonas savastanoi pv. retacarpa]
MLNLLNSLTFFQIQAIQYPLYYPLFESLALRSTSGTDKLEGMALRGRNSGRGKSQARQRHRAWALITRIKSLLTIVTEGVSFIRTRTLAYPFTRCNIIVPGRKPEAPNQNKHKEAE